MGKSSAQKIGYWYGMTIQFGLALAFDELLEIRGADRTAWEGSVTESQTIFIDAPNLYGGEKKEGGIQGSLDVMMGDADQQPNPLLVALRGSPQSAYRGLATAVFDGWITALNPYIKPWSFRGASYTKRWRVPVWEPDLAKIDRGMNAAHIIYRICVELRGWDPNAKLDLARMKAAAQTLYDEGLGLCLKWSRSTSSGDFIQTVCNHVGGMFVEDPTTGQWFLRLLRADYDPAALDVLDETNIVEVISYEQTAIDGTVNQVSATYHDINTNKDASITAQNLANAQAQGADVAKQSDYPGLWNGDLGARIAERDVRSLSALLATGQLKVKVSEKPIIRGDVMAFSMTFGGRWRVQGMPVRILDVDEGKPGATAVIVKFGQDVFGIAATSFIKVQSSGFTAPDQTPHPITVAVLDEATYRDLASRMGRADLATLDVDAAFVGAIAARPAGVVYDYELMTKVDGASSYADVGPGDFTPHALLHDAMPVGVEPITVTVTDGENLSGVKVGTEARIDSELFRVDAIDASTGSVTLARGCVDTVPALHAAGARVWFTDYFTSADGTEYATGEKVDAKLLTRTGAGELDMSLAPVLQVSVNQRAARPYPPGLLQINGTSYPMSAEGALTISWAHRDRITQADQLVDASESSVGPEAGTTYTVRVYLDDALDATYPDLSGPTSINALSGDGQVRIEVQAVRDGLTSWQSLTATFTYYRGQQILTEDGNNITAEDGTYLITES